MGTVVDGGEFGDHLAVDGTGPLRNPGAKLWGLSQKQYVVSCRAPSHSSTPRATDLIEEDNPPAVGIKLLELGLGLSGVQVHANVVEARLKLL